MSQKTLNLCLERYNFVKFGETTKSSHTVLCINNAYSVNSDKYRLTPTVIASKHGDGYVFTLNYDFDRPLFTIVQKSYSLDGTSGNIVFEGIDPISKGGSKYLRKVTVSPVKLSDGSYLLEVTNDEYLRIGTTGAALGDEELESLNEKIVTMGGIEKSVETVGGKQVLKLDASGSVGAKEIVYFEVDPSDPPSGIYEAIAEALAINKLPAIRSNGKLYIYTSTDTDRYDFVGMFGHSDVGYEVLTVWIGDAVNVDKLEANLGYTAVPSDGTEENPAWAKVCELELESLLGYTSYGLALLFTSVSNNDGENVESGLFVADVGSNWRSNSNGCNASWIAYTPNSNDYSKILGIKLIGKYGVPSNPVLSPYPIYKVEVWVKYYGSNEIVVNALQNTRYNYSYGTTQGLYYKFPESHIATPQSTEPSYADTEEYVYKNFFYTAESPSVAYTHAQSLTSEQKAQGRDNIGAASASDVTALQSQVSSLSDVSAYTVKGEATVAQLNAGPSGIQAGWAYQLTDSGTLTDGSLAVVAGDTVAWDGTKWFPLVKSDYYATKTYAQNVAHSIAPEFDPTRTSENPYKAGETVMYTDGKAYTFKVDHYGAWSAADVEQKPFDSFVKNAIFDFSAGTDISASADVTTGKYMNQYGSYNNSDNSKVVLFDVTGVAAIKFSGVFFAGIYQIIYLNENRVGIGYESVYPRDEYITIERVAGNAKYIAFNVPLASSFEAVAGNVSFEGVNSAVQNLDKKTDERTLCSDFDFTNDITASASVTNGKYMKSNGSLADASGFMVVEFAVAGFDSVEFRGFFLSGAYDMIQLDSSNRVLATLSNGVKNAVVVWDVKLHPLATRLVFNCRIAFNFVCKSGSAIKTPVTEKIAELENKTETNAEKIDGLENSVFNKHHEIGDVPSVAYKGNLTDYTWGSASTTYSEVLAKFDELLTPNYAYKEAIGTASDGSTLYIYKFTPKKVNTPAGFTKGLPGIFIMCAQHGFEKGSTFGTWHFLKDVVSNPDKNEFLRYVRNNVNLYVVPVANPYGFDNNLYVNANSVNLNRNWWVPNWQYHYDAQDPNENSGSEPFDQPETAAMRDFILAHLADIDYVVDYHTNGRYNVSSLHNVNWISIANYDYFGDAFSEKVKAIAVNHCQKVNGIIREIAGDALLGITGTEGEDTMCCNVTQGDSFPTTGYGPSYCITQGIMGSTLEGCNGFPNGDVFCDEEKQAMSAIVGCWIQQTLFNFART